MSTLTTPRRAVDDLGSGRYPPLLLASALAWVLLAAMTFLAGTASSPPTDAGRTRKFLADTDNLPTDASARDVSWWLPYLPVIGGLLVIGTALLVLGYGWTRPVLALLGVVAVIGLAQPTRWLAVPSGLLLVVGSALSLAPQAHRYLLGTSRTPHDRDAGGVRTP